MVGAGSLYKGLIDSTPDSRAFRDVMGHMPTGVAVITGTGDQGPVGMTANALSSLSLEPLLLLVCFDNGARTLPVVREQGRFAVNVLRADGHELARLFASKAPEAEKFAGIAHEVRDGVPVLADALAWVVCDAQEWLPGGDHTIAIGAVRAVGARDGDPLVWYRGAYRGLAEASLKPAPPPPEGAASLTPVPPPAA